ncbi:MAG TPA: ChbG/HpnK family deacetylase [Pirellulales bacterium]
MPARIVLHADDFGLNAAVTGGILRGFAHGLLTSTSLLAGAPYAAHAIAAWKRLTSVHLAGELPSAVTRHGLGDAGMPFDLGVHLNLTQGRPLTGSKYPAQLLDSHGRFPGILRLFARLQRRRNAFVFAKVQAEMAAQIAFVVDHGLRPTHLNGHQYVELLPQIGNLLPELLAHFGIPTMRMAAEPALVHTTLWHEFRLPSWLLAVVKQHYARRLQASDVARTALAPSVYFGTAHAGRINLGVMELFLARVGQHGTVEIGMHPGLEDDSTAARDNEDGWRDPLANIRPRELAMLESPELASRLRTTEMTLGRLTQLAVVSRARAA